MIENTKKHILWFKEVSKKDVALVGGKNASLGEMYQELNAKGVKIPNGFAITADAYWYLLDHSGIRGKLKQNLSGVDKKNVNVFERRRRYCFGSIFRFWASSSG